MKRLIKKSEKIDCMEETYKLYEKVPKQLVKMIGIWVEVDSENKDDKEYTITLREAEQEVKKVNTYKEAESIVDEFLDKLYKHLEKNYPHRFNVLPKR